jgi:hypothetical protein
VAGLAWHYGPVIAELLGAAALVAYPPPRTQGLRPGSAPDRGSLPLPAELKRPLHLPRLARGAPCPVSAREEISPDFAPALGPGPVYPIGFDGRSTLHYRGSAFPAPWTGSKVLWVAAPSYQGPIRIRGHQLNGRWWVGFDGRSGRPYSEMRLLRATANAGAEWRQFPSYTRVRARGCYAYQIDGTTFSYPVVFRAAP